MADAPKRKTTRKRTTRRRQSNSPQADPGAEPNADAPATTETTTGNQPPAAKTAAARSRKKTARTKKKVAPRAPEAVDIDDESRPTAPVAKPPNRPAGNPEPFVALGLAPDIVSVITKLGFQNPSDIQRVLVPEALQGKDIIGQARTGTGKTAAFAWPLLQQVEPGVAQQALVMAPTRELAAQVERAFRDFGADLPIRTAIVYGGRRIAEQLAQLKKNPEIIIGTPGRILDLIKRRELDVSKMRFAVLDEVDRMLDIGFRDDIRRILRKIETDHQTIFVSATLDEEIRKLAVAFMKDPIELNVSGDELTVENIEHGFVTIDRPQKFSNLLGFLKHEVPTLAIVFTNTKHAARRVAEKLKKEGINCQEIHGDLHQSKREKVMKNFRDSAIQVLVATDLASRGLDVMEVSHIVNYDVPEDPAVYVHRIGRTARMGNRGYAVTFIQPDEGALLTGIEMLLNQELPRFDAPWHIPPALPEGKPIEEDPQPEDAPPAISDRYREAYRTDDKLEEIGLRPVRRTLGSRFRATRRRR
jgi:ATP-dependent RNA helicase DeaD